MNVVTVWWTAYDGGYGQYRYSEDYPNALKSQIPGLKVLTEGDGLYEPSRYKGWLAKLEVFRPENRHLRPCLCIDLDTFVFDIEPILELDPERLWLIREFLGTKRRGESGLFIAPKEADHIWNAAQGATRDGEFLRQFPHSFIPDEVNGIYSYKAHCRDRCPDDARVVCFHGKPKPREADGWAGEFWRKHAGREHSDRQ